MLLQALQGAAAGRLRVAQGSYAGLLQRQDCQGLTLQGRVCLGVLLQAETQIYACAATASQDSKWRGVLLQGAVLERACLSSLADNRFLLCGVYAGMFSLRGWIDMSQ